MNTDENFLWFETDARNIVKRIQYIISCLNFTDTVGRNKEQHIKGVKYMEEVKAREKWDRVSYQKTDETYHQQICFSELSYKLHKCKQGLHFTTTDRGKTMKSLSQGVAHKHP